MMQVDKASLDEQVAVTGEGSSGQSQAVHPDHGIASCKKYIVTKFGKASFFVVKTVLERS